MKLSRRGVLAGALAVSTRAAEAQAWPTRSIRMIVPFAPGATGDIAGRLYAEELSKSLG
jgi:tripartite-type tricarboxylate transporter receptor subunit TctC